MTPYGIDFHRRAKKFLAGLPARVCDKITAKIDQLADNPRPSGCLKLTDFKPDGWRIRIGGYRVLYRILDEEQLVWVFDVDRRTEDTYKQ